MVGREGFEPPKAMPADLQSAPFDRFGTDPLNKTRRDSAPVFNIVALFNSTVNGYETSFILKIMIPPGVFTSTWSPFLWPIKAPPRGDS